MGINSFKLRDILLLSKFLEDGVKTSIRIIGCLFTMCCFFDSANATEYVFQVSSTYSDRMISGFPHAGFQNTGAFITSGNKINISASGAICAVGSSGCTGPNGTGGSPGSYSFLAPNLSGGALVGRINFGNSFLVGSSYNAVAQTVKDVV